MQELTTSLLAQACRLFMGLAYPEGPGAIPPKKLLYYDLTVEQPLAAFLPPAACALGVCQESCDERGVPNGYAFRLGSSGFAHLKLRLQRVKLNDDSAWVFMVDTHDSYSKGSPMPPPGHPDAKPWLMLQNANRILKEKIEKAFEQNGLATVNSILRHELKDAGGRSEE